jgi:predicted transcriptional regulator
MPTTRISEGDHRVLQQLAQQTGKAHQEIIHDALTAYQREALLDGINAGFARLRADHTAWTAETDERRLWDNTLRDGSDE